MLLCHVCAEARGGGREGALYSVLTASKTSLRVFITDGGVEWRGGTGVDGRTWQCARGQWCPGGVDDKVRV